MLQLVGVLSTDGILLECSRAALEGGGFTPDDVIGKPLWETFWWTITPKTQADLRDAITRAAQGETVRYDVEVYAGKSGEEIVIMDLALLPVKDKQGRVLFLLLEGRDIPSPARTKKRDEETVQAAPRPSGEILVNVRGTELLAGDTREQYRQKLARITLDSMVQFVGLLDTKGTVLEINQVALDAVGIKLSDVEGKPFWTTFWWQVSEEIRAILRESIVRASQGEFVRWDTEIYGRAGGKEAIVIDASLCPVKDEQGEVVFITAEGRDITEKKAHEREIGRQREELAKLDELKTQFFANISHEFRTPLTLMMGPLEDAIAQSEGLSASNRERLELAHRNSLRLLKLVNTLLDFSRIEAGRIRASYEPTGLALLTAELASVFRSAIERAGMKLAIDCAPLSEPVYVDREMWEKIVFNLISNAFKFTFEGEIEVSLREAGDAAELTVRDTGAGIPAEEIPHLFDRFHRVNGARGRSYEGSGIGLTLVQELVKLHSGNVRVESEIGRGSSFIVSIPRGKSHLPADRIEAERALASTGLRSDAYVEEVLRWLPDAPRAEQITDEFADGLLKDVRCESLPQPTGAKAQRILLADDNADMRDYVRRLLVKSGYEIETVADGLAALSAARARKPDLVLTDVMMPRLDGFGLLRELRADAKLGAVPIVLLSARAGEEAWIEGMHAGADDYLIKPFSARELLARVESHLKMAGFRLETVEAKARQEEALQRANAALRRANADLQQFVYSASHDLQEPLRMVAIYSELLQKRFGGKLGPTGDEYIGYTVLGAKRMGNLLKDLRTYAQVSTLGKDPTDDIDAGEILRNTLLSLEVAIKESDASITSTALPNVRMYAFQLEQVFQNLIGNAIRYRSGLPPRIHIAAVRQGEEWLFSVQDNGIGIDPQFKEQIFGIFNRLHSEAEYSGTGMGLAICQRAIERTGGRIWVESEPGRGSTFYFTIPCGKSAREGSEPEDVFDSSDRR